MARLIDAADEVVSFLLDQGWSCCLVGGMVVPRWGEPRATADVNVCLITGLGDEVRFISAILGRFQPRIENAADFAERARVLLIRASNGINIDIALGWTPFERNMLHRASTFKFTHNIELPTASAEDIVVTKAFASRPQDWVDVEGILVKQQASLDWRYIQHELSALCELKEAPEIMVQLEQMRQRTNAS